MWKPDTRVKLAGVQFVVRRDNSLDADSACVFYHHQELMPISGWVKAHVEVVRPDVQTSRKLLELVHSDYRRWNAVETGNIRVYTPRFIEIVDQAYATLTTS